MEGTRLVELSISAGVRVTPEAGSLWPSPQLTLTGAAGAAGATVDCVRGADKMKLGIAAVRVVTTEDARLGTGPNPDMHNADVVVVVVVVIVVVVIVVVVVVVSVVVAIAVVVIGLRSVTPLSRFLLFLMYFARRRPGLSARSVNLAVCVGWENLSSKLVLRRASRAPASNWSWRLC